MISPAYTETETDRANPKTNEYIGDINSAVYGMSLDQTAEFAMANLGQNQIEAVQYYNKIQERKMEALYRMKEDEITKYANTTLRLAEDEAVLYAGELEERRQETQKDQVNLLEQKDVDALLERHGITAKDLFGKGTD